MQKELKNISDKIDPLRKDILSIVSNITTEFGINFLVVGATARDIILQYCLNFNRNLKATVDMDVGINVPNWEKFEIIKTALIETGKFKESDRVHRLYYGTSFPFDIIPFGGIESADGKIVFPPENRFIMTTLGFKESLENAQWVIISEEPKMAIPVAKLENLFVMKLIAWDEKYPERGRDAYDMGVILKYYLEGDNQNKLLGIDQDLLEMDEFDYEQAAARVIGRDIARCSHSKTLTYITNLLKLEIDPNGQNKLAHSILANHTGYNEIDQVNSLIVNLITGIEDIIK